MMGEIKVSAPEKGIFRPDAATGKTQTVIPSKEIGDYSAIIRPDLESAARELGERCASEIKAGIIADFEKNGEYCEKTPGQAARQDGACFDLRHHRQSPC